jgi:hypothetical protein
MSEVTVESLKFTRTRRPKVDLRGLLRFDWAHAGLLRILVLAVNVGLWAMLIRLVRHALKF